MVLINDGQDSPEAVCRFRITADGLDDCSSDQAFYRPVILAHLVQAFKVGIRIQKLGNLIPDYVRLLLFSRCAKYPAEIITRECRPVVCLGSGCEALAILPPPLDICLAEPQMLRPFPAPSME